MSSSSAQALIYDYKYPCRSIVALPTPIADSNDSDSESRLHHDFLLSSHSSKDESNELTHLRMTERSTSSSKSTVDTYSDADSSSDHHSKSDSSSIREVTSYEHRHEIWHTSLIVDQNSIDSNQTTKQRSNEEDDSDFNDSTTSTTCSKVITTYHDSSSLSSSSVDDSLDDQSWISTLWHLDATAGKLEPIKHWKSHHRLIGTYTHRNESISAASNRNKIAQIDSLFIRQFDLNHSPQTNDNDSIVAKLSDVECCTYDSHHSDLLFVGAGNSVYTIDTRISSSSTSSAKHSQSIVACISNAHRDIVLDLDCNPNRAHQICTSSADRTIKVWDMRKSSSTTINMQSASTVESQPLLTLTGVHSHFVNSVSYNQFHDELILSSGCDSIVALWACHSTSSAAIADDVNNSNINSPSADNHRDEFDVQSIQPSSGYLIRQYSDIHVTDTSVYSSCWSSTSPWCFASISYDGRLAIQKVPKAEQYKILL